MITVALLLAVTGTEALDALVRSSLGCPDKGEITVCGRRGDKEERSRFLSPLPLEYDVGDPRARSVSAERNALFDYDGGGAGSCSSVGYFGAAGCHAKAHRRGAQQRAGARDPRGPLYGK